MPPELCQHNKLLHRYYICLCTPHKQGLFFTLADCVFQRVMCTLQAQQQQIFGFERQSMEAEADQEARQALGGPQANTSRSASPCIPTTQQACVC